MSSSTNSKGLEFLDTGSKSVSNHGLTRRRLLKGALSGTIAVAGGAIALSRRRTDSPAAAGRSETVATLPAETSSNESHVLTYQELKDEEFRVEARQIHERHRQQTVESVATLKRKYEQPAFGRMRVWDLVEKLGLCIDRTDTDLFGGSQWLHVQQALAAMEQRQVTDPNLILIAILHDLGKLFLLSGEVPENVVCGAAPLGSYPDEVGLDQVVYQFGHGELIYSRIKDYVPEAVAWTVRYHTINLLDAAALMNDRDRQLADDYLLLFCEFDANFKSPRWVPNIDMTPYRDLIERTFPEPILF